MAIAIGRRWLIFPGAVWYTIVLGSAVLNWWVPYVFGIHPGEISAEAFAQEYSQNLRVLPPILDHPVIPDVQHTLIHLGVLSSCGFSWLAFHQARQSTAQYEQYSAIRRLSSPCRKTRPAQSDPSSSRLKPDHIGGR